MESLSRLREEIVFKTTILDKLIADKNNCAHDILEGLEIVVGKEHKHWITIRKIVLDKINDYHRSICSSLERVL